MDMNPIIATMIKHSGRSWWQCRYSDGKVLSEWDTAKKLLLPVLAASRTSRWEEIPKKGMVGLRLLCPNGMAGELEAPEGHRFFQLKAGGVNVILSGDKSDSRHFCEAHIIGVVTDITGNCLCRAWETKEARLIEFTDNIYDMKYRNISKLNLDVQGIRV